MYSMLSSSDDLNGSVTKSLKPSQFIPIPQLSRNQSGIPVGLSSERQYVVIQQ